MKLSRPQRTARITSALSRYYIKKKFSIHKEFGVGYRGKYRMDVLAMNMRGHMVCIETKSCKADYTSDSKWREYLPYCNQMYIAIDKDLWEEFGEQIASDVRPHGVGLIVVGSGLDFKVKAKKREVCADFALKNFIKMAWRGGESLRTVRR